ncbi:MAG: PEP-utilizing protein mobile subunit [Anaerolineaceae bacterium]|nr:PEP-utilizing protein mobile subunit [Anaerolineaceae bacterium]
MKTNKFPSPFDLKPPPGAEEWQEMYSWYHLSTADRRELDENRFWFQDRLHHPNVLYPYDEIFSECWWHALGVFNTRIFALPPAFGVDQRVINGYLYASPIPVADPEEIGKRAEIYRKRAGHYYENWNDIYGQWKHKTTAKFEELKSIHFEKLPDLEDESVVFSHVGSSSGHKLIEQFNRMILIMYETFQWHFELLNIGYAAYLTFFGFCREAFPQISDQTISLMVGGMNIDIYRPDDELKRLAKKARQLNLADLFSQEADPTQLFASLETSSEGKQWLADWQQTADPWFRVATDPGHPGGYHNYKTWLEDPQIPLAYIKDYILRLQQGENIDRPTAQIKAERDRITAEYRNLLAPEDQPGFDAMVDLARLVFVYIEEHMLYIDHWMWSTFWQKSRQLADVFVAMNYFQDAEDMFFLRRHEVMEALYDLVAGWSVGSAPRGWGYWEPIITKRRKIYELLKTWDAPPALGTPPETVTEPFTVMLWGITTEKVNEWLNKESNPNLLTGISGSPGTVEGLARVVNDLSQLNTVQEGEILVCPSTSPSWSPVFAKIAATVSDAGGIMSHTAIVCREYGLPAVVGIGNAVATIQTGQRLRVDGSKGTVEILDPS